MTAEYQQTVEAVVRAHGSDAARGLTGGEAHARLAKHGPNQLAAARAILGRIAAISSDPRAGTSGR